VQKFRRWAPNLPILFTSWGHIPQEDLKGNWGAPLVFADAFTGDAPTLLDELHLVPGCKDKPSMVFRFGVSEEYFRPASPSRKLKEKLGLPLDSRVIYSARSLRPGYNHQTLLTAAPEIIASFPNTFFIFVNNHGHRYADAVSYKEQLLEQSIQLGISEHLRFLEHHEDRSEVAELMQTSDVVVSIPVEDAFPATIFEAMACGAPLVVSNLPDYDGVVDDTNAIRIPPEDDKALAEAIITLLGHEEKRMELRSTGLKTVATKGNMDLEVDGLLDFYQEILARKQ
jgi:glycosyltransferase involved in cell wall biosynthesis